METATGRGGRDAGFAREVLFIKSLLMLRTTISRGDHEQRIIIFPDVIQVLSPRNEVRPQCSQISHAQKFSSDCSAGRSRQRNAVTSDMLLVWHPNS